MESPLSATVTIAQRNSATHSTAGTPQLAVAIR